MNKTYFTIALAVGLACLSPTGVFAAKKNGDDGKGSVSRSKGSEDRAKDRDDDKKGDDDKGSVSKGKDFEDRAKDRDDDKKGYGKGGRRDDDLCKENPNACKPKPISR